MVIKVTTYVTMYVHNNNCVVVAVVINHWEMFCNVNRFMTSHCRTVKVVTWARGAVFVYLSLI